MNQIEQLIRDGYLKKYVVRRNRPDSNRQGGQGKGRGYAPRLRTHDNLGEQVEEVRGTVTTIDGGFVGGGDTSSAIRKYNRSVMQVTTVVEGEQRGAWEEFAEDPLERVFFAELDPTGELRDDRRPHPTEDLKVMTYIFRIRML
ncbi:hypothetical protein SESBI_16018 [Sesbania bispinosa]|nr:hypothetical protein SESBI_16018 [Sesbania bispinosa]